MLRGLLDLSTSAKGAGIIFKTGLRLQQADLLGTSSPSFTSHPRSDPPDVVASAAAFSTSNAAPSNQSSSPSTSGFVLDLRPTAEYRTARGLPSSDPPPPQPIITLDPTPPIDLPPPKSTPSYSPPPPSHSKISLEAFSSQSPSSPSSPSSLFDLGPPPAAPSPSQAHPISFQPLSAEPLLAATPPPLEPVVPTVDALGNVTGWVEQEDILNEVPVTLKPSRIPSSRIGRLFHYGSLATSLSFGAASEAIRRSTSSSSEPQGSLLLSEGNIKRLVEKLGQMRGAALKLGQFMSIQDSGSLPPELEKVLSRVQAGADYMPDWQMSKAMSAELGPEWRSRFKEFSEVPIASASIGQVHSGMVSMFGLDLPVAVKIQFPGVATSISSDLANLSLLLRSSFLLPKGLFLENTLKVMRGELQEECDYIREAECARRFGALLGTGEPGEEGNFGGPFRVPRILDELSTGKVLTMELMEGKPLSRVTGLSQTLRNEIGSNIMRLCLRELFEFRLMQTDPNWSNFLFNAKTRQIEIIDFGATQEYSKPFMDDWFRLLRAAIEDDKVAMKESSLRLGYLTGDENEEMLDAHLKSMSLLGLPYRRTATGAPFDFFNQTITTQVKEQIPVMLRHRLTPPPRETYSLNRKLSGAFLLCARLGSQVDCAGMWEEISANYVLD